MTVTYAVVVAFSGLLRRLAMTVTCCWPCFVVPPRKDGYVCCSRCCCFWIASQARNDDGGRCNDGGGARNDEGAAMTNPPNVIPTGAYGASAEYAEWRNL